MDWNEIVLVLDAIQRLVWPAIVAVVLWQLFPVIRKVIQSRNFTVKIAGSEISVQDATDQVRMRIEDLQQQVLALREGASAATATTSPSGAAPSPAGPHSGISPPKTRTILWVDDQPSNNAMEIAHLRQQGVDVELAISTEEALRKLGNGAPFAIVISDMGRKEDGEFRARAGLDLLERYHEASFEPPYVIYTTKRHAREHDAQVKALGGLGATGSSIELFEWIRRYTGLMEF